MNIVYLCLCYSSSSMTGKQMELSTFFSHNLQLPCVCVCVCISCWQRCGEVVTFRCDRAGLSLPVMDEHSQGEHLSFLSFFSSSQLFSVLFSTHLFWLFRGRCVKMVIYLFLKYGHQEFISRFDSNFILCLYVQWS